MPTQLFHIYFFKNSTFKTIIEFSHLCLGKKITISSHQDVEPGDEDEEEKKKKAEKRERKKEVDSNKIQ